MKEDFLTDDGRELVLYSEKDFFLIEEKPQQKYYCVFRISPCEIYTESCKLENDNKIIALFDNENDAINYGRKYIAKRYGTDKKKI